MYEYESISILFAWSQHFNRGRFNRGRSGFEGSMGSVLPKTADTVCQGAWGSPRRWPCHKNNGWLENPWTEN